ncbi:MAG: haloacid dehalogenase-like hydrolase [Phycisphaerae bacterium]|nr:haloacid dehalogenase-like hydrolase [Phycisphaerae bacterium]
MLILFDIDATLLTTTRTGVRALERAGRDRFGPAFSVERTEFAGRLDPAIIRDLLRDNGAALTPAHEDALRDGYARHLVPLLATPGICRPLPGVPELLAGLFARADVTVGLLTGNFRHTGCIKLRACGIDPDQFHLSVWADDAVPDRPNRADLPPVALRRFRERHGRDIAPARVTIIGDTPHDVRCARVHGCRVLAVATGSYGIEELTASGADRVVPNLSATEDVIRWLVGEPDRAEPVQRP